MTKYLIYILLLLPNVCKAQQNLKKIRTKSWQTYAYKVTAADVEKFSKWDSIPVNEFVNKKPDYTFELDHFYNDLLGLGNYVVLSVIDNNIHAHLYNNTQLQMLTINNKDKLQIDVRNKNGNYITDAKVFINNIPAKFNQTSQTYWASQRKLDKAQVKIYATNDTMYAALNTKDDLRYPVKQQRKLNFKYSKIYKIIHFVPAKLKGIFKKKTNTNSIGASGYIIFNQPKYKPLDTLKFKAYIVDKNGSSIIVK